MASPTREIPTTKNLALIEKAKRLNHVPWCDDYEKMISGMRFHYSGVPELEQCMIRAVVLNQELNNTQISLATDFKSINAEIESKMRMLLGHMGKHSRIRLPINIVQGCNVWVGDNVYINGE
ncbi:MAG: hypothetical protein Q9222_001851 [Ikaeria aurantiellina]